jgi:hypothetical protein
MNRNILACLLLSVILITLASLGCGSPNIETEQKWLDRKCGQCHEEKELPVLLVQAKKMSQKEFESALDGMAHEGITFTDSEKSEASSIMDKLRKRR